MSRKQIKKTPDIHPIKPGTMAALVFPGKKYFKIAFAKSRLKTVKHGK